MAGVGKPRSMEAALTVGFHLHTGATFSDAAAEAGVSRECVRQWRESDWWPELVAEVEATFDDRVEAMARGALFQRLKEGDAISARWLLERRDARYAPAAKRVEVSGGVDHVHRERAQLETVPTRLLERLADEDDEVVDAFFEEARGGPVPTKH